MAALGTKRLTRPLERPTARRETPARRRTHYVGRAFASGLCDVGGIAAHVVGRKDRYGGGRVDLPAHDTVFAPDMHYHNRSRLGISMGHLIPLQSGTATRRVSISSRSAGCPGDDE